MLFMLFGALVLTAAEKDIDSDSMSSGLVSNGEYSLSDDGMRKAEALKNFALASLEIRQAGKITEKAESLLLAALYADPSAEAPLDLYISSNGGGEGARKVAEKLEPLALANPDAYRLNLRISLALIAAGRVESAIDLLEASSDYFLDHYSDSGNGHGDGHAAILMLIRLYGQESRWSAGDVLIRRLMRLSVMRDDFSFESAAAAFYSLHADSGKGGWWIFRDREAVFHDRMQEHLESAESIWLDSLRDERTPEIMNLSVLLRIYKEHSQFDRGENMLLETLLSNPGQLRSMMFYAAFLADAARFADAFRIWQKIVKQNPDQTDFHLELGRMAFFAGWYPEAIKSLEWYLLVNPEDSAALYQLGVAYLEEGKYDKAIYKLNMVKVLPEALYMLAVCHRRSGDFVAAVKAFEAARDLAVEQEREDFLSRGFYLTYAYFCERAGEIEKCARILRKLNEEDPNDDEVANFLGYLWADAGKNLEAAEKLIRLALDQEPDNFAYLDSLAWVLYRQGRFAEAKVWIDKSLAAGDELPDAVIADHAGDIYHALGENESAIRYWTLAAEIWSDDIDPEKLRGKIEALRKKLENSR